jgi:PRTRC genetic system protein C
MSQPVAVKERPPAAPAAGDNRPRVFLYQGQRLPDPNPALKPDEVRDMYAATHDARLTTASVVSRIEQGAWVHEFGAAAKEGVKVHEFERKAGTKG